MRATPHRNRRVLGGALCLAAIIAVLVGGIARADAATHHRSAIVASTVVGADSHSGALRVDQAGLLAAAAAVLVLAGLFGAGTRSAAAFHHRLTAGSPAPRGPPRQAR